MSNGTPTKQASSPSADALAGSRIMVRGAAEARHLVAAERLVELARHGGPSSSVGCRAARGPASGP